MRGRELRRLFPEATLEEERIGPLVKSFRRSSHVGAERSTAFRVSASAWR